MEKEERVDKAFETLTMGRSSHAEFRGEFEDRLEYFVAAEMPVPDAGALKRKYLTKLAPDLKTAVLNNLWPLAGEDQPARKPTTWGEGGDCCEMELQNRGDSQPQTHDGLYALGPSPAAQATGGKLRCKWCQGGHYSELCASNAAATKIDAQ